MKRGVEIEQACQETVTGSLRLMQNVGKRDVIAVAGLWWDGWAKDGMYFERPAQEVGLVLSMIVISTDSPTNTMKGKIRFLKLIITAVIVREKAVNNLA